MTDLSPDSPLSLDEAAKICLRGLVKASTLRAAADRGDLAVERIGKRLVTTPADVEAWRERCRVPAREKPNGGAFRAASQRQREEDMQRSIAACRATIEKLRNRVGPRSKPAPKAKGRPGVRLKKSGGPGMQELMTGFIDPPSELDTIEAWRKFLTEMEQIRGQVVGAEEHVELAKRIIAEKEAEAE